MTILTTLILPIHGRRMSFHFVVSFSISFNNNALSFSGYRSFTSFVMFILRYFILLVAIAKKLFSSFLFLKFHF